MENKKVTLNVEDMQVVDGRVVISSEELAAMIQDYEVVAGAEEEAEFTINFNSCGIVISK